MQMEGIKNRWKEYTEELYSEDKRVRKEKIEETEYEKENRKSWRQR